MAKTPKIPLPKIPLPKSWPEHVKSAMLHVISLAQYATAYTRGWADAANSDGNLFVTSIGSTNTGHT